MAYAQKKHSKKNGTYYLAVWRVKQPDGTWKKRAERYNGDGGKRGAEKHATLREAEAANHKPEANANQTVADFLLNVWLPRNSGGQSYSTRYSKERIATAVSEIIGTKKLGEITALDFGTVKIELEGRGLAPSTINNNMKLFKRAMKDAHEWRLIPSDSRPWEGVKPIKQRKAPPRVVTRSDGLAAADYLRDKKNDTYTADLVTVLAYTGLRLSEALGLHWEDIDWDAGTIRIWRITARTNDPKNRIQIQSQPKTAAGHRTLPITKAVSEVLERRQKASRNRLVFPDSKGRPAYSSAASKPISAAFSTLGISGTAHGLRHGAITRMLEMGVPLNQVSKLAGHESSDITAKIYLAWADDTTAINAMREAMED